MTTAPSAIPASQSQRTGRRITPRTFGIAAVPVLLAPGLVFVKLRQDARRIAAFERLEAAGFTWTLGGSSPGGPPISLWAASLKSTTPIWTRWP